MSVVVDGLTKIYGTQHAVNNISFSVKKGEILGFLGPNGAGKTTTMKIISCFVPKTSGTVKVCGFDTETDAMEVRQRIGYLPEHNPLYMDMYVKEYLLFVAGLHKVKNKKQAVNNMIERTGLGREQHKHIGALSKGYRQRVGLAQAMLHDPEVLILDEPTSGLDPNQLVEIRKLIRDLGREKTVIFSSHIMQEVQALCDRIVIINKGDLAVQGDVAALKREVISTTSLTVEFNKAVSLKELEPFTNGGTVTFLNAEKTKFKLTAQVQKDIRPAIFNFAVKQGLILLEMHLEESSIEDVFQKVTQ
jgi:ABC-2 type transport system ATP-binding protein